MDLTARFIEANFLYDCITQMEMQTIALKRQMGNNIGSGKYQMIEKLAHDQKILKGIYDENRYTILKEYEKQRGIEFELLKTPKDG